jgi:hypothetical protein
MNPDQWIPAAIAVMVIFLYLWWRRPRPTRIEYTVLSAQNLDKLDALGRKGFEIDTVFDGKLILSREVPA